jgi:purine-binding chemotaxis protein CheW
MAELVSDDFINSILEEIEKLEDNKTSIAEEGKYITFTIAGDVFGILLLKVREIVKITPLTNVVESHNHFRSFISLRNQMIPAYNLRSLLGIETIPFTDRTCIIILETWHNLKLKKLGIIVDAVRKTLSIKEEDMAAVPEFLKNMDVNYLLGIAKMNNHTILLLNTDNIKNLV